MILRPPRFPLPRRELSPSKLPNPARARNQIPFLRIGGQSLLQFPESLIVEIILPIPAEGRRFNKLQYLRPDWILHSNHLYYTHCGYTLQSIRYGNSGNWNLSSPTPAHSSLISLGS